ncbi:NAD(P)H-hydrate dehydratase [Phaeobacter gallaeciensis]|uniref:NAD(P)H-hydrate dehydratase n=1 Tax=Phaeobacter gallaeciensis TaxID=60890 RepID=UPI00237FB13C|nr:NAD(P)H-hydrate dehydratase [Phaeobacter gallaeciensis]MDE4096682.1 NAD(P)H-hydrate dehydratase [Phaeobacter gallaeciensis]MDE4105493.1 NAD(P)H-hydrate dehydratase [Phaeobacter gallaeciensis]MDE4109949.1 NAD(P)H-hydrate dehydratase [Phaeobacter gallaeciensis]MDE4114417.1 NAD(P)H-hydrate dehydratase [Phaeobacter gallaeciensis]MDE4118884.1 NAD(P)H-hydrate dehydratase [Phaeobacter gallaeciensis]
MTELLTAAQMRAIEQAAIESGKVTGLELMERAGQGVVEAIFEEWPDLDAGGNRAVVLCGPGNNGGDGFVVARLLKERGWAVEVFLYGDPAKLPPDAKANYERWSEMGDVTVRAIDPPPLLDDGLRTPDRFDLLVDALFGTGLTRPLKCLFTIFSTARSLLAENGVRVVGVDLPSGVCSDSGQTLGAAIGADLTVTFHQQKLGHFLGGGSELCGKLVVKDIGLKGIPRPRVGVKPPPMGAVGGCPAVPPGDIVQLANPSLVGKGSGHKFSHGHALILTGGAGKTGAARLSARGALRIGAGLVTLGVPPSAQQEVACQITALMLQRVVDAEALAQALKDTRLNALCLGPGLGLDRARDLVPAALAAKRATVLDADALSAFADAPEELFPMLHENCVLTPHGGEFARLFPDIAAKLNAPATKGPAYSKVDATREAAVRAGCVVLFKGADTVIAAPNGRCFVNSAHFDRAAPWLATAGSGDVLAGFITGLLARGLSPMQAAESAAWLHVDCALEFGPGLIAEDLPEQIPAVFRKLGF